MPLGARTAVTDEPGEPGANNSRPSCFTAARVALASNCAFSTSFGMPICLTYFSDSASARIRAVAGVQLDSPSSPFFFSFLRLK